MELSPVLAPNGRPLFTFGGMAAWKTHSYRGWVVSLEWVGRGKKAEAAMCIWPESNVFVPGSVESGTWVIGRRAITLFVGFTADDKCTGSASEHCYRECLAALPVLGKDPHDKHAFMSLVDTVIRFAPDLVTMPTTPRLIRMDTGVPMWDMTLINKSNGKTLSEREV